MCCVFLSAFFCCGDPWVKKKKKAQMNVPLVHTSKGGGICCVPILPAVLLGEASLGSSLLGARSGPLLLKVATLSLLLHVLPEVCRHKRIGALEHVSGHVCLDRDQCLEKTSRDSKGLVLVLGLVRVLKGRW